MRKVCLCFVLFTLCEVCASSAGGSADALNLLGNMLQDMNLIEAPRLGPSQGSGVSTDDLYGKVAGGKIGLTSLSSFDVPSFETPSLSSIPGFADMKGKIKGNEVFGQIGGNELLATGEGYIDEAKSSLESTKESLKSQAKDTARSAISSIPGGNKFLDIVGDGSKVNKFLAAFSGAPEKEKPRVYTEEEKEEATALFRGIIGKAKEVRAKSFVDYLNQWLKSEDVNYAFSRDNIIGLYKRNPELAESIKARIKEYNATKYTPLNDTERKQIRDFGCSCNFTNLVHIVVLMYKP